MTIWPGRTHRFGDHPDQPVIDSAGIVASAQPNYVYGLTQSAPVPAVPASQPATEPAQGTPPEAAPKVDDVFALVAAT